MGESLLDAGEHDSQRRVLIRYLLQRVQLRDWHAVSDAANDLRELEAKREGYLMASRAHPLTVPPSPSSV